MDYNHIREVWKGIQTEIENPNNRVIYLEGPPGLGKTWAALNLGRQRFANSDDNVYCLTLNEESSFIELRGSYLPKGHEGAVWFDGVLPKSMKRPAARLVINEPAFAGSDILTGLYPVLDSRASAVLALPNGDVMRPGPNWHCILTDNQQVENLPGALRDRIDSVIMVDVPSPGLLEQVLTPLHELLVATAMDVSLPMHDRIGGRSWVRLSTRLRGGEKLQPACIHVFGQRKAPGMYEAIVSRTADGSGRPIEDLLLERPTHSYF